MKKGGMALLFGLGGTFHHQMSRRWWGRRRRELGAVGGEIGVAGVLP